MGDLRPDQTSGRRPARKAPAAPEAPPAVRAALGKLRDAAAAHDEELRVRPPGPPRSGAAQ
jgi:hypothetical protein